MQCNAIYSISTMILWYSIIIMPARNNGSQWLAAYQPSQQPATAASASQPCSQPSYSRQPAAGQPASWPAAGHQPAASWLAAQLASWLPLPIPAIPYSQPAIPSPACTTGQLASPAHHRQCSQPAASPASQPAHLLASPPWPTSHLLAIPVQLMTGLSIPHAANQPSYSIQPA